MQRNGWEQWLEYVRSNAGKLSVEEMAKHIGCTKIALYRKAKRWRAAGHKIANLDHRPKPVVGQTRISKRNGVPYNEIWIGTRWKGNGRADGQIVKRGPKGPIKPIGGTIEKTINGIVYIYERVGNNKYKSLGRKDGKVVRKGPVPKPKMPKVKKVREKKVKPPKIIRIPVKSVHQQQKESKSRQKLMEQIPTRVIDPSQYKTVQVARGVWKQVKKDRNEQEVIEEYRKQQEQARNNGIKALREGVYRK